MTSFEPVLGLLDSALSDAAEGSSRNRPEDDRIRQSWALALAQTLTAQLTPTLRLIPLDSSPNPWQRSDVGLTASEPRAESSALASSDRVGSNESREPEGSNDRITAEVDGGQLGRVKLSVNRGPGGLTIEIGAASTYALHVLDLERNVLLSSLRAGGLSIESVSITTLDQVGTSLAPAKSNVRESVSKIRAYKSHLRDDDQETDEGLDLIG